MKFGPQHSTAQHSTAQYSREVPAKWFRKEKGKLPCPGEPVVGSKMKWKRFASFESEILGRLTTDSQTIEEA